MSGPRPAARPALAFLISALVAIPPLSAAPPAEAPEATPILAHYTFDDGLVDTGPDTFTAFETARGTVGLSTAFRHGGERAVELVDAPGDGDFPELVGRFPRRDAGLLWFSFAFLLTDPAAAGSPMNVALVGPEWFRLARGGFAFWLTLRDGTLRHYSDSIPKRLFEPAPFTWYGVELLYDIDAGTYELTIFEEGGETPVVRLVDQPNAAAQPGSAVERFSFITDFARGDLLDTAYYVDDILVATARPLALEPFIAPGRRRLFVEYLKDRPRSRRERAADARFLAGDAAGAGEIYRRLLAEAEAGGGDSTPLLLKLADVAYVLGDLAEEKRLRESLYGSLTEGAP